VTSGVETALDDDTVTKDKFNQDEKLSISGTIATDNEATTGNWTSYLITNTTSGASTDFPFSSSDLLTKSSQYFDFLNLPSPISFPLAISANVFTAPNVYAFRLTADGVSYAQISLTANSAPSNGRTVVSPTFGTALIEKFTFSANRWTVSDVNSYPLSYSFSYQTSRFASLLAINSLSENAVATGYLPAGAQSSSFYGVPAYESINQYYDLSTTYLVLIEGRAVDYYSAEGVSNKTIRVLPSDTVSAVNLSDTLSLAYIAYDVDTIIQSVNGYGTSYNAVNCSGASATYCKSLKREVCYATPNTCGKCLSGYLGIVGDSNIKCIKESNVTSTKYGVGAPCSNSKECVYGLCKSNVCAAPPKKCPTSFVGSTCSGNGTCYYVDNAGNSLSSCSIYDVECTAVCNCTSGYGGKDCSLDTAGLYARDAARTTMCSAINFAYKYQDASAGLVDTIAGMLGTSFTPDEIITSTGVTECSKALTDLATLVYNGYLNGAKSQTKDVVTSTLSAFIVRGSEGNITGTNGTTYPVAYAIDALSVGILSTLVDGEAPTSVVSSNIRMTVQKSVASA
jgi:hypothetical protein